MPPLPQKTVGTLSLDSNRLPSRPPGASAPLKAKQYALTNAHLDELFRRYKVVLVLDSFDEIASDVIEQAEKERRPRPLCPPYPDPPNCLPRSKTGSHCHPSWKRQQTHAPLPSWAAQALGRCPPTNLLQANGFHLWHGLVVVVTRPPSAPSRTPSSLPFL